MHDITRALFEGHPTWPGDTPYTLTHNWKMAEGASVNVMSLSGSTHLGTHLDAPFHYHQAGHRLGELPLDCLIGEARVIDAHGYLALPAELITSLEVLPPRVLFNTGQPARWEIFPEDFTPLTPELIHALAERGVTLVGTDSPSVDRFDSKELPVHKACAETGIYILEGLELSKVPEGSYELLCLPLSLPHADASPVRAVLR